ncbi:MAG: 50S ribosomal protein L10 [Patescibacteria group bacterium]|nr:50S ribosomal protein L10 [Patescibacteria group bacterium]
MVNQRKKLKVKILLESLQGKTSFVLLKFGQTPHQVLESLRNELRKKSSQLKVVKNTLFEKTVNLLSRTNPVFQKLKREFFPLKEPSALVTFETDWSEEIKTLFEFMKKGKSLNFKFGLLDNQIYSSQQLEMIAQLPGRKDLMVKLIFSLKSPAYRLRHTLGYPLRQLLFVLKEKSQVKS